MSYPISDVTRRVVYSGSAGTGPYNFTFEVLSNTDIAVYKNTTLLTLTTDYTVSIGVDGTGSVTLVSAATGSDNITLVGNRSIERSTDFVTGGDLFANTLNTEFDSLVIFAQQVAETASRGLKAPITDPTDVNMVLPIKSSRKGKVLAFDETTGDPVNGPALDSMTTVIAQSDNINTVADNIADVNTVAADIADVSTVAGIVGNVTTVAGIASNVTTVAGVASNVTTVAGISTDVSAVADIAADVSAVENIASNVTTVAGIASNVTTVAGISANVTTVAGVSADVTTVATDIADVSTCADNIAAILDAPTQATNASNSAIAAAASAAAAAASYDSFDDRYLGAKSSDPTLDNDGNALVTGALYYSTTSQAMKVYDGATWITATAAGTTAMNVFKFVATAGQTTFSGSATVGGTLSYTSGNILVFVNGAALDSTDYTATNGTSVVLTSAASLNDEVVIVAFKSFTVADALAKTGGTLSGDLTLDNGNADGAQLVLNSSGYSSWNLDNYSGRLRAYYGATEYFTINTSGNVGIGTSSPSAKLTSAHPQGSYGSSNKYFSGLYNNTEFFNLFMDAQWVTHLSAPTVSGQSTGIAFDTAGSERARIDSSGNLLVGVTSQTAGYNATVVIGGVLSPSLKLVSTSGPNAWNIYSNAGTTFYFAYNSTDKASINQSTGAYTALSDVNKKKDFEPSTIGLAEVLQLQPKLFRMLDDADDAPKELGFVAQEVQPLIPQAYVEQENGNGTFVGLQDRPIIAALTKAIQELKAELDAAKADIATLKGQV